MDGKGQEGIGWDRMGQFNKNVTDWLSEKVTTREAIANQNEENHPKDETLIWKVSCLKIQATREVQRAAKVVESIQC